MDAILSGDTEKEATGTESRTIQRMDDPSTSTDHGSNQGVPETGKEMELDKDLKQKREVERLLKKEEEDERRVEMFASEGAARFGGGKITPGFPLGYAALSCGSMIIPEMARQCELTKEDVRAIREMEREHLQNPSKK